MHPDVVTRSQQRFESRKISGRGDDQHIAYPGEHQRRQRVVDHRFVVHWHELLADNPSQRMLARARPARQDDSSHLERPIRWSGWITLEVRRLRLIPRVWRM